MPNSAQFAANPFGVNVKPLDFTVADAPTTKTYHGASIVVNGNIVGRIQSWQASGAYTRSGTHVYEVSHVTWGHPVDYVPGRVEGFTIAVTRVEVWNQELEIALGYGAVFDNLMDQDRPFEVLEYLFRGQSLYRVWKYSGCWFQDKNEDAQTADGDGIFRVTATVAYVNRVRVQ
jgi:hypothetical protein